MCKIISREDALKMSDIYQCVNGFDIEGFTDYIFSKLEQHIKEVDSINDTLHKLMKNGEDRGYKKSLIDIYENIKKDNNYIGEFSIIPCSSDNKIYEEIDLYFSIDCNKKYKIIILEDKK